MLRDISFQVGAGEIVGIVGRSGVGKTTLLRALGGLTGTDGGSVLLDDRPVHGPPPGVVMVFQDYQNALLPWRTVARNVWLGLEGRLPRAERRRRAGDALHMVGLDGAESDYPAQLSGGMAQRVQIARALAMDARVLLMDEPFGALDALTRRDMQRLLTRIWEQHRMTVLMITHDIEEALITSDRVVVMTPRPGRVAGVVEVPLPRPRSIDMIDDPGFRRLHHRVLHLVQPGLDARPEA